MPAPATEGEGPPQPNEPLAPLFLGEFLSATSPNAAVPGSSGRGGGGGSEGNGSGEGGDDDGQWALLRERAVRDALFEPPTSATGGLLSTLARKLNLRQQQSYVPGMEQRRSPSRTGGPQRDESPRKVDGNG